MGGGKEVGVGDFNKLRTSRGSPGEYVLLTWAQQVKDHRASEPRRMGEPSLGVVAVLVLGIQVWILIVYAETSTKFPCLHLYSSKIAPLQRRCLLRLPVSLMQLHSINLPPCLSVYNNPSSCSAVYDSPAPLFNSVTSMLNFRVLWFLHQNGVEST